MATVNPRGLYTQNQGIFNAKPYILHEEQLMAQKAAKDDAINKYYQELPNRVNGAGLDDGDIEGLNNRVAKIKEFWMQNAPKIKKGNTPENYNYQKLIREAQGYTEKGKDKVKNLIAANKIRTQPTFSYLNNDPNFYGVIEKGSLPMDDPNYSHLNAATLVIPPKPFDRKKWRNELSDIKPEISLSYSPIEGDRFNQNEIQTPKFTESKLNIIRKRATDKLYADPTFETEIKGWIKENQDQLPLLQQVYEDNFGHPMKEGSNGDLATAYTLFDIDLTKKVKTVPNYGARQSEKNAEWNRRNRLTFSQSMAKIAANRQNNVSNEDIPYLSDSVADENGEDITLTIGGKPIQKRVIYTDKVDPSRLEVITGRDISKNKVGVKPIAIKQANGTYRDAFYQDLGTGDWEGAEGQKISRERVKDDYINKFSGTKFKSKTNTRASENTKDKQTPPSNKPKADNSKSLSTGGWKDRATKK